MSEGFTRSPEAVEAKKARPPILSVSEMGLYLKTPEGAKKKLSEIGNPSYQPVEKFVEYLPGKELVINGTDGRAVVPAEVLFNIPHGMGFVEAAALFGKQERVISEREFEAELYATCRLSENKLRAIQAFAKAAGWPDGGQMNFDLAYEVSHYLPRVSKDSEERKSFPSPEEVLQATIDRFLSDNHAANEEKREIFAELKNSEFVTAKDTAAFEAAAVPLFYQWARLKGINLAASPEATWEALDKYPLGVELVKQYRRHPGPEFGDDLLVAAARAFREWTEI